MTAFGNWLRAERSPLWLLAFACMVAVADLIIQIPLWEVIESYVKSPEFDKEHEEILRMFLGDNYMTEYKKAMYHVSLFSMACFFALLEEIVFRTIPLGLSISAQRRTWFATGIMVISALIASVLAYDFFPELMSGRDPRILTVLGALLVLSMSVMLFTHKPWPLIGVVLASSILFAYVHQGWWSIFMQGISGVTLCVVYLKCGGMAGKWLKATWHSTLAHALFNTILFEYALYELVTKGTA